MNEKLKEIFQGKVVNKAHTINAGETWGCPLVFQFLSNPFSGNLGTSGKLGDVRK